MWYVLSPLSLIAITLITPSLSSLPHNPSPILTLHPPHRVQPPCWVCPNNVTLFTDREITPGDHNDEYDGVSVLEAYRQELCSDDDTVFIKLVPSPDATVAFLGVAFKFEAASDDQLKMAVSNTGLDLSEVQGVIDRFNALLAPGQTPSIANKMSTACCVCTLGTSMHQVAWHNANLMLEFVSEEVHVIAVGRGRWSGMVWLVGSVEVRLGLTRIIGTDRNRYN